MSPLRVERGVLNEKTLFDPLDEEIIYNGGEDIFVRDSRWGYVCEDDKGAYVIVPDGIKLVEYVGDIHTYGGIDGTIKIPIGKEVVVLEKSNNDHGPRAVRMTFVKE